MIRVLITGDYSTAYRVESKLQSGDFDCLKAFKPYATQSDFSIVNFESPIVLNEPAPIKKSGPNLYCSSKGIECLVANGFNCVTLANNHFFDQGQQGVEDTICVCKREGVSYVGGGLNRDEARSILYLHIRDQKLAIINACEHEFSIADESHGGSNPIDIINMHEDIVAARKEADFVLLILHGGIEHYHYPTPRMKRLYRHFVDMGADAVINHHQHCINGYEVYHEKPIFYGLGNFFFPWETQKRPDSWYFGFAVRLLLDKQIGFEIIPFKQTLDAITICEKEEFNKDIEALSLPIRDDDHLFQKFDEYIFNHEISIKMSFLPSFLRSRLFTAMARRGWLGKLYKGRDVLTVKNKLSCESHAETIKRMFTLLSEKE